MNKKDYVWHFTFQPNPFSPLVIEENHPDLKWLQTKSDCDLVAAALIDIRKFSVFDTEEQQLDSVVAATILPPSKLIRIFRRVEADLTTGAKHRIPAFQYRPVDYDHDMYCFIIHNKIVLTADRRQTGDIWHG